MKISGSIDVPTTPDRLWSFLQDPEFLKEIMPGCKEMKQTAPDEFVGLVEAKVGAIASRYTARFKLTEKQPPDSYRLLLDGDGKGGFVRADTQVTLTARGDSTELSYAGEVTIGGTIARIGQRLVESAAKMLINKGFESLKKKLEERLRAEG